VQNELLAVAVAAAQAGGEVLKRYFGGLRPEEVSEKGVNDWVSAADRASEDVILEMLHRLTPGIGVLAEESGRRGDAGLSWVVDPLDGTANFVRRFPHFGVSVALVEDDRPLLGAVFDPLRDDLFSAAAGKGAWRNGAPCRVSTRPGLAGSFLATGFPFRVHPVIDTYLAMFREVFLQSGAIRRPGAATLDLAHTAVGIFDGFFELALSPWDLAAGILLIRESGGVVTNFDGGRDVFTSGNVIAGGPSVHRELLRIISARWTES